MVGVLVGAPLLGPAGCSCEAEPETAIMVEVDSDIALAAMNRVRLQVDSVEASGERTNRLDIEYALAERGTADQGGAVTGTSTVRLPIRIAVLPRRSRDGAIQLRAAGLAPGQAEANVFASSRLSFVPGRTLLLRMMLLEACVDVVCPEGQTCTAIDGEGICVDFELDRPECTLEDLEAGRVEGCAAECSGPADCDDGSACTVDGCENALCTHAPACGGETAVCCDGACAACCGDEACDDGIDCTDDTCAGGACVHASACGCANDEECGGGVCCDGACLGCCGDAECDDGDGCTDDACEAGACRHPAHVCPEPVDSCTTTACTDGLCVTTPVCALEQVCCDGACNSQCCTDAECPEDGPCVVSSCVGGQCAKAGLPDRTPCPEGICYQAWEACVQCLEPSDCGAKPCQEPPTCNAEHLCEWRPLPERTACADGGTMCCEGACVDCCDDSDCVAADPCETPTCGPEGRCARVCLEDGAACGAGLTCQGCVCQ